MTASSVGDPNIAALVTDNGRGTVPRPEFLVLRLPVEVDEVPDGQVGA